MLPKSRCLAARMKPVELAVTTPDAAAPRWKLHRHAFSKVGWNAIWLRIIALVVQPGVESDHTTVIDYQPAKTACQMVETRNADFQRTYRLSNTATLRRLVIDHFAILKVGPGADSFLRGSSLFWRRLKNWCRAKAYSGLRVCWKTVLPDLNTAQSHYGDARVAWRVDFSFSDRVWPLLAGQLD